MLNKRNPRITSIEGFVNVFTAFLIVFFVAVGYVSAITELPVI